MTNGERILQAYTEQIEVKYLRAIRNGWTDPAVIVDVQNQDKLRQVAAQQRGVPPSEIEALVGVVVSGDRQAVAEKLSQRFPNHSVAKDLATETPPEGDFPVLIITGKDTGGAGIHFFYRPKPELPDEEPPTAVLCGGQVTHLTQHLDPSQQRIEFKLRGSNFTFLAGPQYLLSLKVGDQVYAACRVADGTKATVLDMLHCSPPSTISQSEMDAFHTRLGGSFGPPEDAW
jgi:hypothetical protein